MRETHHRGVGRLLLEGQKAAVLAVGAGISAALVVVDHFRVGTEAPFAAGRVPALESHHGGAVLFIDLLHKLVQRLHLLDHHGDAYQRAIQPRILLADMGVGPEERKNPGGLAAAGPGRNDEGIPAVAGKDLPGDLFPVVDVEDNTALPAEVFQVLHNQAGQSLHLEGGERFKALGRIRATRFQKVRSCGGIRSLRPRDRAVGSRLVLGNLAARRNSCRRGTLLLSTIFALFSAHFNLSPSNFFCFATESSGSSGEFSGKGAAGAAALLPEVLPGHGSRCAGTART